LGRAESFNSFAQGGKRQDAGAKGKKIMLTILKVAVAGLIAFGVLSPSFTPKADNAKCTCKAD
jgi:hypothetical protein